eukprot:6185320-Pleurochrysis_carterae.AAC.2
MCTALEAESVTDFACQKLSESSQVLPTVEAAAKEIGGKTAWRTAWRDGGLRCSAQIWSNQVVDL